MNSYIVNTRVDLIRQAGDTGSIEFVVPALLPLTGMSAIFEVVNNVGTVIFTKETPTDIDIDGQTITVNLANVDTAEISGQYSWELQINSLTEIITIGKGTLTIESEIITETTV